MTAVDANQAVSVMLDQINTLKTNPVTTEKIAGMAGQILTNYYLQQETNAAAGGRSCPLRIDWAAVGETLSNFLIRLGK